LNVSIAQVKAHEYLTMASKEIQIGGKSVSIPTGLFINGEFVEAQAKQEFDIENPATGKVIISVQERKARGRGHRRKSSAEDLREPRMEEPESSAKRNASQQAC
jgi:hypothetical protein